MPMGNVYIPISFTSPYLTPGGEENQRWGNVMNKNVPQTRLCSPFQIFELFFPCRSSFTSTKDIKDGAYLLKGNGSSARVFFIAYFLKRTCLFDIFRLVLAK